MSWAAPAADDVCAGVVQPAGNAPLKRTRLHSLHVARGGKMGAFCGWDMPIDYPDGVLNLHLHTRQKAGLFDVSHMGQLMCVLHFSAPLRLRRHRARLFLPAADDFDDAVAQLQGQGSAEVPRERDRRRYRRLASAALSSCRRARLVD
jgi:hypothetical protein